MSGVGSAEALPGLAALDWPRIEAELDQEGWAVLPNLLDERRCRRVRGLYDGEEAAFRTRIVMARHGFGRGEYKYFSDPLPPLVGELRTRLYPPLVAIANRWQDALGIGVRYPAEHAAFLARCHEAGQTRPTPLLLRYGADDYNCLHQDLYGEHVFPLQVALLLSEPGEDFTGGEFVLAEQRPRMQSRVAVVPLSRGDGVVFAVNHRPVRGGRGSYRVVMRHGVSKVRWGQRHTLGIIFHDSK
ncbi:MAG: 2OG-Fe(II) oxygenase [Acetobacteraceae bacterium]|nr:2OG-Fe(II) oxygenase [Acetobacteraceae bacterium]